MGSRAIEIKVGLVVAAAILLLFFGIMWGKRYHFGTGRHPLLIRFDNASGLGNGDPVTVNGVRKGRVDKIFLYGDHVIVRVLLDPDVKIYPDARAYIEMVELMGGKKVEIKPGSRGQPLDLEHLSQPIEGQYTTGIPELISQLSQLALRIQEVVNKVDRTVDQTLGNQEFQTLLLQSVRDLHGTSSMLRDFLARNNERLNESVENIYQSSYELRQLVNSRRGDIDSTIVHIRKLIEEMEGVSSVLNEVALRIKNREGNLGKLIYDEEMFRRFSNAAHNLDSLSTDLRKNLGRYMRGVDFQILKVF